MSEAKRKVLFKRGMRVLALGPHADDVELGCGATLLYLRMKYNARIHYVVFSDHFSAPKYVSRKVEIRRAATMLGINMQRRFECLTYTDTEFPNNWRDIQRRCASLKEYFDPQLVLAPREDNHQDHVVVAQAAKREFRQGQMLWHYEIKQHGVKEFSPDIFVDVSAPTGSTLYGYRAFLKRIGGKDSYAHLKVHIIQHCMASQRDKPFLHPELLLGLMRHRGMQVSAATQYAEGFEGRIFL